MSGHGGAAGPNPIVYVRYNSHAQFTVAVTNSSNVAEIKQAVAEHHGVDPDSIKLIFAGRELDDNLTLSDCQVDTQSILHAVTNCGIRAVLDGAPVLPSLDATVLNRSGELQPMLEDAERNGGAAEATAAVVVKHQARFYVYCKAQRCRGVTQGKLRVRCSTCKDGAFVLSEDPQCWEDVKVRGKIKGQCRGKPGENLSCGGDVAEFYFKCSMHPGDHGDDGGNCVVLDLLQYNTYNMPCITCMEENESVVMVFPCDSSHVMCLGCFHVYGTTKLNDRTFQDGPGGYTISCPAPTCINSFIKEIHHFRLLGDDQYERYQKFGTEDFILREGGVCCPEARCGNPIPLDGNRQRRIRCPYCSHDFCKVCKEGFHDGSCNNQVIVSPPDDSVQRSQLHISEDAAESAALSRQIIKDVCKNCPNCNIEIEKDGGCMHMTCRCGFQWCWLCGTEWGPNCQSNHWFGQR